MNAASDRSALLAALLRGNAIPWARFQLSVDDFVAACDGQQVTLLVYRRARALAGACEWPDAIGERLARRARAAAARELLVRQELIAVLDALADAGVFPIVLKGTALAYSVYDDPAMRPRLDTDLLIRSDEADRVRTVLGARGYSSPAHCDGALLFCQFPLRRSAAGVEHWLDIHWKISTQSLFAEVLTRDEIEPRTRPLPRLSVRARTLAPDEALLLACIHPVMHHRNVESLIWLYDVHLLASSLSDAEWLHLAHLAVARRMSAICAHQLTRAQATFRTPIPDVVLAALRAADRREPSAAYLRENRSWIDELAANIRGLPRWRDRLRLVREIAFPGPAYMLQSYGLGTSAASSMMLPLLYVHRLLSGGLRALAGHK